MAEQAKQKFALIGTSSAGKTTLSFEILAKLKRLGVLVDGVLQQDRRLFFERDKLETHIEAQYAFIFNMVVKETELVLKDGTEVVLSDRSVLDFYAYLEHQYGRVPMVWNFVKEWLGTYTALYYLPPLRYHADGSRPSEDFRDKVDLVLQGLIEELRREGNTNIKTLPRELVYQNILCKLERIMSSEELDLIPHILGIPVLVGGSYAFNRATKKSDVDIYVLESSVATPEDKKLLESKLKSTFGVEFEIHTCVDKVWDYLKGQGFLEKPFNSESTKS